VLIVMSAATEFFINSLRLFVQNFLYK
jgi:hypothetical protein